MMHFSVSALCNIKFPTDDAPKVCDTYHLQRGAFYNLWSDTVLADLQPQVMIEELLLYLERN